MSEEIFDIEGPSTIVDEAVIEQDTREYVASELNVDVFSKQVEVERVIREAKSIFESSTINNDDGTGRTVLCIGYVQSGKTLSFSTVLNIAKDNKYNLAIVIGGTKKNLRNQTHERLSKASLSKRFYAAKTETSGDWDKDLRCNLKYSQEYPEDHVLCVIVCLKHVSHIKKVIEFVKHVKNMDVTCLDRVLIIDDEADQASLDGNQSNPNQDQTPTYKAIQELRVTCKDHALIQYTATPEAILLQEAKDYLSPNAVKFVSPGVGYTGGTTFFDPNLGLVEIMEQTEINNFHDTERPPPSIETAINHFLVGVAISTIRGDLDVTKLSNRSLMFHPHIKTNSHTVCNVFVERTISNLQTISKNCHELPDLLEQWHDRYKIIAEINQKINQKINHQSPDAKELPLPSWNSVAKILPKQLSKLVTYLVNSQKEDEEIDFGRRDRNIWVLIGGQKLERGFTVEGLSVSHVMRKPSKNQDTQQQWARFFGYKKSYLDTCLMFMTQEMYDDFKRHLAIENFLRWELQEFASKTRDIKQDFQDFRQWSRRLLLIPGKRPTRGNVLPASYDYRNERFDDKWLTIFERDPLFVKQNLEIMNELSPQLKGSGFGYEDWCKLSNTSVVDGLEWSEPQKIAKYDLDFPTTQLLKFINCFDFSDAAMNDRLALFRWYLGSDQCSSHLLIFDQGKINRSIDKKFQLYQGANINTGYPGMRALCRDSTLSIQLFRVHSIEDPNNVLLAIGIKLPGDSKYTMMTK